MFLTLGIYTTEGLKNNNKGKELAWDVTVPDTYADSHVVDTATMAGAAADKAASTKETKYRQLANSHVFVPVAIETAGTWNRLAVELGPWLHVK